jgi:CubicO group peptidase (beta-lactamase class C family)
MRWIGRCCAAVLFAGSMMAQLRLGAASSAGLSEARLKLAAGLLEAAVHSGSVGAAAILVVRNGRIAIHKGFGRMSNATDAPPVEPDSVFLLASITKPVTAAALMLLVERGMVSLNDPVNYYLPEFAGGERGEVRVRDLLSHTSGLPDMLPENTDLRRRHAPLSAFVQQAYTTPLLFAPQRGFRYQSAGVLLAGTIVEKLTGMPLRQFEQKEIFDPLGMKASSLGLGGRAIGELVQCGEPPNANSEDERRFGANTPYWRDMGAPWGGMHSTTSDLAILLETFLEGGMYGGRRVFSPSTVRAMTSDQNVELKAPWGLGWALGRSKVWNAFGDLVSPNTFGHAGATGTLAWADPDTKLICVILTNRAYDVDDGRLLRSVSNVVAASVEK